MNKLTTLQSQFDILSDNNQSYLFIQAQPSASNASKKQMQSCRGVQEPPLCDDFLGRFSYKVDEKLVAPEMLDAFRTSHYLKCKANIINQINALVQIKQGVAQSVIHQTALAVQISNLFSLLRLDYEYFHDNQPMRLLKLSMIRDFMLQQEIHDQNGVDSAIYSLNAALDDAQQYWSTRAQEETRLR